MRLDYDRSGPDDEQCLILLHGLSSSRESYDGIVDAFNDRWRVLNVDLRGHGQSPRANSYRAIDYAADVAELIEAEGAGTAVIIGQSLGGLTAAALAATRPNLVAAILLEDPPLFEGDADARAASPAASLFAERVALVRQWQRTGATVDEVAAVVADEPSPHGGTAGERLGPERIEAKARALLAFDPAAMDAAISGDTWDGYDPAVPISCPVTVLAADPEVGAVFGPDDGLRLQGTAPNARIETISGRAHGIHDDPAGRRPYLDAVERFLASLS